MRPRPLATVVLLLALGACAGKPRMLVVAPSPAPVPVAMVVEPGGPRVLSTINAGLSPAATVWHVRAALNVAALACRGPGADAMVAAYNAMLTAQKAPLRQAETDYAAEYKARGGDWRDRYDDAMTRLYNFFSATPAHDAFCATAAQLLAQARVLAPGALPQFATTALPTLDSPFAATTPPPVVQRQYASMPLARAAMPAHAVAAVVPAAARRPRLDLDPGVFAER